MIFRLEDRAELDHVETAFLGGPDHLDLLHRAAADEAAVTVGTDTDLHVDGLPKSNRHVETGRRLAAVPHVSLVRIAGCTRIAKSGGWDVGGLRG